MLRVDVWTVLKRAPQKCNVVNSTVVVVGGAA
jgi:hypothetical protein